MFASRSSCSSQDASGRRERELLDLVELVDADHAARVAAGRPGLAPEARREGDVAERELVGLEDLAGVQARERDLGGAGEVQAVGGQLVDVLLVGRERAGADQRLLPHEHGRQHADEALLGQPVEREAVQREREPGRVADPVAEARARHPRGPLHVEPAHLGVLARLGGARLADAPHLGGVLLRRPVRDVVARGVRDAQGEPVALFLRGRELLLGDLQLLLHALQLLELLGRRLSLQLRPAAELVHARDELAPALVGGEQRVERLGRALPGQAARYRRRIVAGGLEVDHARESRSASSTDATPASFGPGHVQSERALRRGWASATAMP